MRCTARTRTARGFERCHLDDQDGHQAHHVADRAWNDSWLRFGWCDFEARRRPAHYGVLELPAKGNGRSSWPTMWKQAAPY